MHLSNSDPSLYLFLKNDTLIGMNGMYADDLLQCGRLEFEKIAERTYEKFETVGTEELPFTFAGVSIWQQPDDSYALDQLFFYQKLETLQASATFL